MTELFIETSKLKHGNMYDYTKVNYENNLKEVIIICKTHGEFLQLPKTHKRGNGCKKCGLERTKNAKTSSSNDFIQKAKLVHGDNKYNYTKVEYKKANKKIIIICKKHGVFEQTPNSHLGGAGCNLCANEINSNKLRKTLQQFINEANIIHNEIYDYSDVEYNSYHDNIKIICKTHGEFHQTPANHLRGAGCYLCGRIKIIEKLKYTTQEFINNAKQIHGDKFDYSKATYTKCDEHVIIICKEHGDFLQTPTTHLKSTFCCQKCVLNNIGKWNNSNGNDFIQKAKLVHDNKYNYDKTNYDKAREKVLITCLLHGDFEITPNSHLNGSGCYHCGKITMSEKQSLTKEEFIKKSIEIHKLNYDYSNVEYINNHTNINIICKKHGNFIQTPQGHLSGRGCIKCANKYSYTSNEWIHMAKELHGDKYDYSKTNYISANDNVIITCKTHGDFEQIPRVHLRPTGCFRCNPKKFSKMQILWLNFMEKYYNINIQHAMNGIEYTISTTKYKADGYCIKTNTVFEFHGDLYHGNPKKFNPNNISYFGVKYGDLYQKTLKREQLIKDLGYNLVVMWEYDWTKINKSIKILQRKFCNSKHCRTVGWGRRY